MEKNKSIDGLVTRRSKKAPVKTKPTNTTDKTQKASTSPKPRKTTPLITNINQTSKDEAIDLSIQQISLETQPPKPQPKKHTSGSAATDFLAPTQIFDFDEKSGELKAAQSSTQPLQSKPVQSPKKSKKHKKPMSKKRKIITWTTLIIVFILIVGVIGFIIWGNEIIAKITGGQGNVFDLVFPTETYVPLKTDDKGRTNILAFGTSGYNMDGDEGNGIHDGAQLTDSIMVISLDQETGDIAMLSLPRDLKASPTCTATGKINEVYWCNNMEGDNEQSGAEALMAEVGDILGIDFQYYAHLNWGSLIQIVDILGGITITLDEGIYDYYYTEAVFEPGVEYTINGAEALGLARARHGTTSGDFSRGASQQKILIGIKDKITEKGLSITDLLSLANTLGDNLRTNFSIDEIKTLAHMSSELDLNNMRQISLIEPIMLMTTSNINGISYVIPSSGVGYYYAIQDYVAKMFSSDPRVYENYTILVLNATETPGLASIEQTTLEEDGYSNIYIDDAPEGEYAEDYTLYTLTDTAPGTKKLLEEKYGTSASVDTLPSNLPTDYDFILIVNPTTKQN